MAKMAKSPAAARAVVQANQMLRGCLDKDDYATTLVDALCNLRHWADRYGVDFDKALEGSYRHYHAEAVEPDEFSG